jgi:hypothetical protein
LFILWNVLTILFGLLIIALLDGWWIFKLFGLLAALVVIKVVLERIVEPDYPRSTIRKE